MQKQIQDYIRLDEIAPLQPNGFLNIESLLTRTGIFSYSEILPDGTMRVIKQLRHPDEVFAEAAMESMVGLPVTENHPTDLINPENAKDFIVGMASERPKRVFAPVTGDKEEYVQQKITFFDKAMIEKLVDGEKRELSLGYQCTLDDDPGEWNGQPYDFIQRDIIYNHLSVVDRARGGASCRVLLDSEDLQTCDGLSLTTDENDNQETEMKIKLNGVEYDEAGLKELFDSVEEKLSKSVEDSKSSMAKLEAERDELQSKIKTQDDNEDVDKFSKAVASRVALETKAVSILGDSAGVGGLTDTDIKTKVITHIHPKANLDGKEPIYIDARFDAAIEDYEPTHQSDGEKTIGKNVTNSDEPKGYEEARQKSWLDAKEMWKKPVMAKA